MDLDPNPNLKKNPDGLKEFSAVSGLKKYGRKFKKRS